MPFTLARLPKELDEHHIHLFLGQDFKEGWTFANRKKGCSMLARYIHRKAGLSDSQFVTHDVLPCNHDWTRDLDFFVSCKSCRTALMEEKDYDSLEHINPALPEEPTSCLECCRRHQRLLDWMSLQLAAIIKTGSLSGAKIFLTPAGSVARFIYNHLCRKVPMWIRQFQLEVPSRDISHPNAVSFAQTISEFRSRRADYGRLVLELHNFHTGSKFKRWPGGSLSFYCELGWAYKPFSMSTFDAKRMANIGKARDVITTLVENEVRAINQLIGVGDCLEPIDVGVRFNRLVSQIHSEKVATSSDLADKITAIPAKVRRTVPVGITKVASQSSGNLTRNAKRGFFDRCYTHLYDRLSESNEQRIPFMKEHGLGSLILDPAAVGGARIRYEDRWKSKTCKTFQNSAKLYLKSGSMGSEMKI